MEHQMNKNKGFSLIELLIAMTILAIIMIMVTQFMVTSSRASTKTKKNLNIQTESMEVGEQISDILMQATYIRVRTEDNTLYTVKNTVGTNSLGKTEKEREISPVTGSGSPGDLVVDNYPNYFDTNYRDIILDGVNYRLVKDKSTTYPLISSGNSEDPAASEVQSLRLLTSGGSGRYYVKPKYIYVQYQKKSGGAAYVIYEFNGEKIKIARGDVAAGATNDGFQTAIDSLSNADKSGELTKSLSDCYFSADTKANTVFLDMNFMDKKYKEYTYNYAEAIVLRNTNVLTVPPQKMYKLK